MRLRSILAAAALAALLLGAPAAALAQHGQPTAPPAAAQASAAQGEHAAEGEHANPIVAILARLFNFALLAGTLVYFLKNPLAKYLVDRGVQIRSDLVKAADMRAGAAAQMTAIEQKMAALPGELDALRRAGAKEAAAEEARIRQAAEAERVRLLDQARREIDAQLKLAERDLVARTADLAVEMAAKRVKNTITADDHARLVDQYLGRLAAAPSADTRVTT